MLSGTDVNSSYGISFKTGYHSLRKLQLLCAHSGEILLMLEILWMHPVSTKKQPEHRAWPEHKSLDMQGKAISVYDLLIYSYDVTHVQVAKTSQVHPKW